MLIYDGGFKPKEDDSNLLFVFQEWGHDDTDFMDDFREVLVELMADLCGDYQTAIVIKSSPIKEEKKIDSVKIGNGANVPLLNAYFDSWSFSNITTKLYVISSEKEITFQYENMDEYIKKLLDMPYIIRFDFDPMYNESDILVDIGVIDKEFIVESVKKLCDRRKIDLDISIFYDKPKSGE
ncbi:MAG: hypothetical protein LKJ25_00150 [Clostridia bacterium]|nr:hypothetical protein [Clostridia bacterium]